jgi:hypothetical protein
LRVDALEDVEFKHERVVFFTPFYISPTGEEVALFLAISGNLFINMIS